MLILLLGCIGFTGCSTPPSNQYYVNKFFEERSKYKGNMPTTNQNIKEEFLEFRKVAQFIELHNQNDGEEWEADFNVFSVMSGSEKAGYLGLNISSVDMGEDIIGVAKPADVDPEVMSSTVDYSSKLPGVKNQGGCGSCWTFGAVVALEYQVNKNKRTPISLSEQQYLDCVYEGSRDGCKGGWPSSCYSWSQKHKSHIAKTSDYPYVAKDGKCNYSSKPTGIRGFTITGTKNLAKGDQAMLAAVADKNIGVISVAIMVTNSFYQYKTGVYSSTSCNSRVNHAVDVVGYGTLNNVPYFRVRNSWGMWGDKGYINMKRGTSTNVNMCLISDYGHYPLVTGSGSDNNDNSDNDNNDDDRDNSDKGDSDNTSCSWVTMKVGSTSSNYIYTMSQAKSMCEKNSQCTGFACNYRSRCRLSTKSDASSRMGLSNYICQRKSGDKEEESTEKWCTYRGKYLQVYSSYPYAFTSLQAAKDRCSNSKKDCSGITYQPSSRRYTARKYSTLRTSRSGETSYMKC